MSAPRVKPGTRAWVELSQADIDTFSRVLREIGPVEALERIADHLRISAMVNGERGDKVAFRRQYDESLLVTEAALKLKMWRGR